MSGALKLAVCRTLVGLAILLACVSCAVTLGDNVLYAPKALVHANNPRDHEGRAGVYLGYLFDEPAELSLTFRANRESFVWLRSAEDFLPVSYQWRELSAPYGSLRTLYVEPTSAGITGSTDSARPLIVHCYGNSSNLYNNATYTALTLLPLGDVLQFEYPGFDTARNNDEQRRIANFDAMLATLAEDLNQQAIERPLIFWGHSLGGLICAELAARVQQTDGLILEATGASAQSIVTSIAPKIAGPFLRFKLDPRLKSYSIPGALQDFTAPVLVLGATLDKTLPVKLARELYEILEHEGHNVIYEEFPQANHLSLKAAPLLKRKIKQFLRRQDTD